MKMRKQLYGVMGGVVGKNKLMLRFQYGFDKVMILHQLTNVTVDSRPKVEESQVPIISFPTVETVYLQGGYYHGVCLLLQFKNYYAFDIRYQQKNMESDPDEQQIDDMMIDN